MTDHTGRTTAVTIYLIIIGIVCTFCTLSIVSSAVSVVLTKKGTGWYVLASTASSVCATCTHLFSSHSVYGYTRSECHECDCAYWHVDEEVIAHMMAMGHAYRQRGIKWAQIDPVKWALVKSGKQEW